MMKTSTPILLLATALAASGLAVSACTAPTGLGTNGVGDAAAIQSLKQTLGLPYLWTALAPVITNGVLVFETPIQFQQASAVGHAGYNLAAMYHPVALDVFGDTGSNGNRRLCTADPLTLAEETHLEVASAYHIAYIASNLYPQEVAALTDVMNNVLGFPYSNLDLVPVDPSTPWGLAKITVDEILDYMKTDGWNTAGDLDATFNKMPYADFSYQDSTGEVYTPYQVQPSGPPSGTGQCSAAPEPWLWSPLQESDDRGYFTRQEHVTPHAGFTGRLQGLTKDQYLGFSSPPPDYDYCEEADFVLSNTNTLATSDEQKMAVEYFDSKFTSLFPLQITWSGLSGLSLLDFWWSDMALVSAFYDSVMLVWREKVVHNKVRPTEVVETLKKDVFAQTYGGPFAGSQQVKGQDWQPYIRTMPHAEYPSGSSCVCTAFAEMMQLLSGSDAITVPLEATFPLGSSRLEPGVTPATEITFTFTSWSQIQHECGVSREYGGMHFSQAVSAGEDLCSGLSSVLYDKALKLLAGDADGVFMDFNDREIVVKTPLDPNRDCTAADPCDECAPRDCDKDNQCKPGLLCADKHKQELQAAGLDKRRADCGPATDGAKPNWEVCFQPDILLRA